MEPSLFQQVVKELLGENLTIAVLIAAYIFAFFGMILRWFFQYNKYGKKNPDSPAKFSWSYWIKDNVLPKLAAVLATIIIIFVSIRFPQELFGTVFSYGYSFAVGMSLDYISSILKNIKVKPVQ